MHAPGPTEPKRLSGTLGLRDFLRTTPAWPFHTSPKIGTSGLGLANKLLNMRRLLDDFAAVAAAEALPDEHVDRVLHELNVAVGTSAC